MALPDALKQQPAKLRIEIQPVAVKGSGDESTPGCVQLPFYTELARFFATQAGVWSCPARRRSISGARGSESLADHPSDDLGSLLLTITLSLIGEPLCAWVDLITALDGIGSAGHTALGCYSFDEGVRGLDMRLCIIAFHLHVFTCFAPGIFRSIAGKSAARIFHGIEQVAHFNIGARVFYRLYSEGHQRRQQANRKEYRIAHHGLSVSVCWKPTHMGL